MHKVSLPSSAAAEIPSPRDSRIPDSPWLALVADKVKSLHYGVIQITVHDSQVVQVERTERHRFEISRG